MYSTQKKTPHSTMSSNHCTDPAHIRAKKGTCDVCGGCRKCPPPASGTCSTHHIGTRTNRQSKSSTVVSPTRKKGPSMMRPAKRKAREQISAESNNEEEEEDYDEPHVRIASVEDLLRALNVDANVRKPLKNGSSLKQVTRWAVTMEKILEQCLTLCCEGDMVKPVKFELTK